MCRPAGAASSLSKWSIPASRSLSAFRALEPLGAEVAWVQGANAGLRFQRPLHPAVFDQLMDRFTACAA